MARRSYFSVNKRQRDQRKKEKAERKLQRRQERIEPNPDATTTAGEPGNGDSTLDTPTTVANDSHEPQPSDA
jgi:hypothetical protein